MHCVTRRHLVGLIAGVSLGVLGAETYAGAQSGPIRMHGTVEAVRSRTVIVPRLAGQTLPNLVITYLVAPGKPVKPGDLQEAGRKRAALRPLQTDRFWGVSPGNASRHRGYFLLVVQAL